jgi:glyoxylase-like metal-dependent hydrolase (beta-lactamase superfamily II)
MSISFEILLPGIPVTTTRGGLGWCTIVLIQQGAKKILFDTGSYNTRPALIGALKKRGFSPEDIDTVFISHLHDDHVVNAEMFGTAELLVSENELNDALAKTEDLYIPLSLVDLLKDRFKTLKGDEIISEGIKAVPLPGHTPGQTGLLLESEGVLLAGDAVKNAWEFVRAKAMSPCHDEAVCLQSYEKIKSTADIVVPGHDRPFRLLESGRIEYTQAGSEEIRYYDNPYGDAKTIRIP